ETCKDQAALIGIMGPKIPCKLHYRCSSRSIVIGTIGNLVPIFHGPDADMVIMGPDHYVFLLEYGIIAFDHSHHIVGSGLLKIGQGVPIGIVIGLHPMGPEMVLDILCGHFNALASGIAPL